MDPIKVAEEVLATGMEVFDVITEVMGRCKCSEAEATAAVEVALARLEKKEGEE